MSDRGLPCNLRQQHGFGSHTYSLINVVVFVNIANSIY
jgi:catalase